MIRDSGMKNSKRKKIRKTALFIGTALVFMTGCGSKKKDLLIPEKEQYAKTEHLVETVQCGDLKTSFSLLLKGKDYTRIEYRVNPNDINTMIDSGELVFDGCYVSQGQKVNKGDLLLSYTSRKLDEEEKKYQDEINENNMTIEHYERLMDIDKSTDYSGQISRLRDKNEVLTLQKAEVEKKRDEFRIYAEEDGTISYVYKDMTEYLGYIFMGDTSFVVISESTGSSIFTVDTDEDYDFKLGEIYEATTSMNTYKMKLTAIEDAGEKRNLTFEPEDETIQIPADTVLTMKIDRPIKKNAVYVSSKAIKKSNDDRSLVYIIDENGFRHAVEVETGEFVENKVIITKGLSGGESVSLD